MSPQQIIDANEQLAMAKPEDQAQAQAQIAALQSQCDHKMPDGSTATSDGTMYQCCPLCGTNL